MFERHSRFMHQAVKQALECLSASMDAAQKYALAKMWDVFVAAVKDDTTVAVSSESLSDFPVVPLNDPEFPDAYEFTFCIDDKVTTCKENCELKECQRRFRVILQLAQPGDEHLFESNPSFIILNIFPDSSDSANERQRAKHRSQLPERMEMVENTS